jgi:hypothetical protein
MHSATRTITHPQTISSLIKTDVPRAAEIEKQNCASFASISYHFIVL